MEKFEIVAPKPEKALLVLREAIERHKQLLAQSVARTHERIQQLAAQLRVDPDLLLAGKVPHPEGQNMDLFELEGELAILRHLRDQIETLEHLTLCH
jgi:hypothetical protein